MTRRWTRPFTGVRGRVTFTVLAVSAILFSALGTFGFVRVADGGRAAIRERIGQVLDQLEAQVRAGTGTVTLTTPDGVDAAVEVQAGTLPANHNELRIERTITVGSRTVQLVGRSSQARLTDSLRSLYRGLWIAIPLASVTTALMAGIATSRALRPVGSITALAGSIGAGTAGVLDDRVPVPDTGDEVEHLARTLNAMLDRIGAGQAAQRRFTSDAAHELRTPLMALQAELELVHVHPDLADDQLNVRLRELAQRLGARIDDLVLLATLDEGRSLAVAPVVVLDVVADEAPVAAPGATVEGTRTEAELDRALVARAVRNLLANANRHARSVVAVRVADEPGGVAVHVDDDGPGIDAEQAGAVMDRFTRLDEARGADAGGSGLGLAIVGSVAAAHGGRVTIDRSPLGGARVSLHLPLRPPDHGDR